MEIVLLSNFNYFPDTVTGWLLWGIKCIINKKLSNANALYQNTKYVIEFYKNPTNKFMENFSSRAMIQNFTYFCYNIISLFVF
jgi:hypothetical protein